MQGHAFFWQAECPLYCQSHTNDPQDAPCIYSKPAHMNWAPAKDQTLCRGRRGSRKQGSPPRTDFEGSSCLPPLPLIFRKQFYSESSFVESFQSIQFRFQRCNYISSHTHISPVYVMFNLNHIITITTMTGTERASDDPIWVYESERFSWQEQPAQTLRRDNPGVLGMMSQKMGSRPWES